VIFIS